MPEVDRPVTLCVDAGTTLLKAVAFDDGSGTELAVARVPTAVRTPVPGHSEQDMEEVWAATVRALREVTGALQGRRVGRLAVTAQGDGAWLVDPEHHPVGAAVLWNDARAESVVSRWAADGVLDAAFARNGSLGNLGMPHAVLRWLQQHDPDRLRVTGSVLTCGSWLYLRLTGRLGLHPSDASAPWLDIATGTVDDDLLAAYGLTELAPLVPPVLGAADLTAGLQPAAASAVGLPAGLPVVLAPYDVVSTSGGAGAVRPGQACTVLGTTLCTATVVAAPDTTGAPAGLTLDIGPTAGTGRDRTWLRAFPTLAGTGVVDWAVDLLGLTGPAELVHLAGTVAPGADGLGLLPYLSPAGERAPFLDPSASGLLSGLHFGHGRRQVARAVLEGLGNAVRECLETGGGAAELRLCGGGAASAGWAQLLADLTGVPTVRTTDTEVGAKGALLHAFVATGEHADLATAAAALVRVRDRFEPDPAVRSGYDDRYAAFLATRAAITPHWAARAGGAA